jgi:hypothetical protein
MSNWNWWVLNRRGTDPESAAARYLAWEFIFSVDGMAEHLADRNALKRPVDASRSILVYGGPGVYYTVPDPNVPMDPAFARRAARLRTAVQQTRIRHLKRRLARFRRQPVPEACRTFAHYQETALELEIDCHCLENREYIPQLDLWDLLDRKREHLAALERAQTEKLRLREQYRDLLSHELKSVRARCERKMTWMLRNWRF